MSIPDVGADHGYPLPVTTVYIVRISMSGGGNVAERKEIDGTHEEVTWAYAKEVRERIAKVRSRVRAKIVKPCVPFHGLLVTREMAKGEIIEAVAVASKELQEIDGSLSAQVSFIPLDADRKRHGELYGAVSNAIRAQVYKTLLPRLKDLAKQSTVPKRSRLALLDLCDKVAQWNVLDDPNVARTIAEMKRQFEADVIAPVAAEVEQEFKALTGPAAYVEYD